MTFQSEHKLLVKILRNSLVLGGISSASQMLTTQDFSYKGLMTGVCTGVLVALIEIKHAYKITPIPKFKGRIQATFFF